MNKSIMYIKLKYILDILIIFLYFYLKNDPLKRKSCFHSNGHPLLQGVASILKQKERTICKLSGTYRVDISISNSWFFM